MVNEKLMGWGIFIIIIWVIWIAFLVIRKMKGDAYDITRGDVYGWLKK